MFFRYKVWQEAFVGLFKILFMRLEPFDFYLCF